MTSWRVNPGGLVPLTAKELEGDAADLVEFSLYF